jgi:hypothetical protein
MKDVPAHHGVDLGRVMKKERAESPKPDEGAWTMPGARHHRAVR